MYLWFYIRAAEQTPLTALYVSALTVEAGFPPGVLNVGKININKHFAAPNLKCKVSFEN